MMTSGIDALMTTKFHITLAKICFFCSLYGVVVLMPVHSSGSVLEANNNDCSDKWDKYIHERDALGWKNVTAPTCVQSNR